jgi:hypothetical protein
MKKLQLACAVAVLCCTMATAASAMPIASLSPSIGSNVDEVRWVCGAYSGRCWWRPNYHYGYGAYAYYPRRHYHRWHHHWW